MFAGVPLARRIEAAEGALVAGAAETVRAAGRGDRVLSMRIGGGVGVFTTPGAPWNKVVGLGFEPLDDAALDALEQELQVRGCPVRVELPTVGDNTIAARLTARGYSLAGFENVLGLAPEPRPGREAAPHIAIDRAGAGESRVWIDTVITGFEHPDPSEGPRPTESFSRETLESVFLDLLEMPDMRQYFARIDGAVAGGASLRVSNGVAQLCGAATLPAFRRRGVQTALLNARLQDAADAGCEIAVVTTEPGSKSQQNVQRNGFALLYTRAILVRTWEQ